MNKYRVVLRGYDRMGYEQTIDKEVEMQVFNHEKAIARWGRGFKNVSIVSWQDLGKVVENTPVTVEPPKVEEPVVVDVQTTNESEIPMAKKIAKKATKKVATKKIAKKTTKKVTTKKVGTNLI